ncbi:MAG: DUF2189 domain-containing protein [Maricaulaceae bacterium]
MSASGGLPAVRKVALTAPFGWLAGAWGDLWRAPLPCLAYGLVLSVFAIALAAAFIASNAAFWVLAIFLGLVFVAPMLAMGLYEAGRMLELGERPTLGRMLLLKSAFRADLAYLGLALLLIFLLWGRIAQVVYGLSTYSLHRTVEDFVAFAVGSAEGRNMMLAGSLIGGVIAFITYCLVVVSAPMLLDRDTNVFAATATSVRAVTENFGPMLLWAVIIVALMLVTAATGFAALVIIFPWLGLASWRAYRALVDQNRPRPPGAG